MTTSAAGVRVAIHEPKTVPFPEEQGFDAPVGSATAFAIRANEIHRTEYPYNNEDWRQNSLSRNSTEWNYNGM